MTMKHIVIEEKDYEKANEIFEKQLGVKLRQVDLFKKMVDIVVTYNKKDLAKMNKKDTN